MSFPDKALWIIERNSTQPLTLDGIAAACGVSRSHLAHAFGSADILSPSRSRRATVRTKRSRARSAIASDGPPRACASPAVWTVSPWLARSSCVPTPRSLSIRPVSSTTTAGFEPFKDHGMPIGLQIVGKPRHERTVLTVAHQYELSTKFGAKHPIA